MNRDQLANAAALAAAIAVSWALFIGAGVAVWRWLP